MKEKTSVSVILKRLSSISDVHGDDFAIPVRQAVEIIEKNHGGSSWKTAKKYGAFYNENRKLVIRICDLKNWVEKKKPVAANDEIGGGETYYTPDAICAPGGFLEKLGVDVGKRAGDMKKFLKISDDIQLTRYRGNDCVKLIGRRPAKSGCGPKLYEIDVTRGSDGYMIADIVIDNQVKYRTISYGGSRGDLECMSVSSLHRLVKRHNQANRRRRDSRKRKAAEKRAAADAAAAAEVTK